MALGHHRFRWLHVAAFGRPTSGETVWCLRARANKPALEPPLAAFARESGAGRQRPLVLVLDNAGWHGPKGMAGITPVLPPAHSPELQPAERLWPLPDEAVANKHLPTLADPDAATAERRPAPTQA